MASVLGSLFAAGRAMIVVVCTDDPDLVQIADESLQTHPEVFVRVAQVFQDVPTLGVGENLFLIAHGAYEGDDGNPVIGDEDETRAFYLNAVQLWENIQGIFPVGYRANVYIDACETANHGPQAFSFGEVFKAQIQAHHGGVRVFARAGTADGDVPIPDDPGWQEAE